MSRYLLDLQPGLAVVLAATTGANTDRYIHGNRGIHAQQLNGGAWQHTLQDGLGSVREIVDNNLATLSQANYSAYGTPDAAIGSPFAFTGEQRDGNGLQFHRARYYAPGLGVWVSEDPLETPNRYGYVGGNVVNRRDRSGLQSEAVGAACLAFVLGDGPFPFGDAVCLALIGIAGIASILAVGNAPGQFPAPSLPDYYPPGGLPLPDSGDADSPEEIPYISAVPAPEPPPQPQGTATPEPAPFPFNQEQPNPTGTCTPTPTPRQCGSKVYRVQGGTPPRTSPPFIEIGMNGGMIIRRDLMRSAMRDRLWVTFDNPDRALQYLITNRPGGYIIGFDIETHFVQAVSSAGRLERQKQDYSREVWAMTPIIGDPSTSFTVNEQGEQFYSSYGLPEPWMTGMEQAVCEGSGFIVQ